MHDTASRSDQEGFSTLAGRVGLGQGVLGDLHRSRCGSGRVGLGQEMVLEICISRVGSGRVGLGQETLEF